MYIDLLYIILFDKDTFLYINEGQISLVHCNHLKFSYRNLFAQL